MGLEALTQARGTGAARGAGDGEAARTRVKICGITRIEDARAAVASGADAIGFVFYPPSPRAVTPAEARRLREVVAPFVSVVGLFVNAEPAEVARVAAEVRLDLVQYHGDESPETCAAAELPYLKAIRMRPGVDPAAAAARYAGAAGLVLDAFHESKWGGSGRTFDWSLIDAGLAKPVILAGGLSAANVADAIARVRPYAVDVSGGVESAPGIKDAARIMSFVREVNRAATVQREA